MVKWKHKHFQILKLKTKTKQQEKPLHLHKPSGRMDSELTEKNWTTQRHGLGLWESSGHLEI